MASGTTEELESGLKREHEVLVSIGDRGRRDEALTLLETLPGVERVSVLEEKNDQVSFSLAVLKGQDVRPAVSRLFVKHQIPLLEIRSGRLSLEEIFMKIVLKEGEE